MFCKLETTNSTGVLQKLFFFFFETFSNFGIFPFFSTFSLREMGFVLIRHSAVEHRRVNMGRES